jgi:hypothetical protein
MNLVRAVESIAKGGATDDLREAGWLVLGSLEHAARAKKDTATVAYIEGLLKTKLGATAKDERVAVLEAAGNGGCEACDEDVAAAAHDPDWRLRRVSAAARRFRPTRGAVDGMCERLEKDDARVVREQAAWSMQWRGDHDEQRVDCLARAASRDTTSEVRRAATRSLTVLAPASPRAFGAVERLADESSAADVRAIAEQFLSGRDPVTGPGVVDVGM